VTATPGTSPPPGALFARLVLALSGLAFAAIGVPFLLAPAATAARVDVSLAGALADNDVRAVYGGLQVGCAAFLLWCAARSERVRLGLAAQLLLFGGLFAGRVASWLAVGLPPPLGLALHAGEALGLACGLVARRGLGPAQSR
jgi:hypothetical protein